MAQKQPLDFDVRVGSFMRIMRHQKGLTLAEAGAALGITYQQMQKYEKGTNRMSAAMLYRYAAWMRCPISSFFEKASDDSMLPNTKLTSGRDNIACANAIERIPNMTIRASLIALIEAVGEY